MKNKLICALLALVLVAGIIPFAALPAGAADLSGNGTQDDPFVIKSKEDWVTFHNLVKGNNTFSGKYVRLDADIDIVNTVGYEGSTRHPFSGDFNGNGHTITMTINGSQCGLFATLSGATIHDVTVTGTITGGWGKGGIAFTVIGPSVIENCVNRASIPASGDQVGGIIGRVEGAGAGTVIRNCQNFGAISGQKSGAEDNPNADVGGILGYAASSVTIENCQNFGTVSSSAQSYGGIVGRIPSGATANIANCQNSGTIAGSGTCKFSGGIVGNIEGNSTIDGCVNFGAVTMSAAGNNAGGIAGGSDGSANSYTIQNCANFGTVSGMDYNAGGIIGTVTNSNGTVQNCANYGNASANNGAGGIAGNNNSTLVNCYSVGTATATSNGAAIAGRGNGTLSGCYYTNGDKAAAQTGVQTGKVASEAEALAAVNAVAAENGWQTWSRFAGLFAGSGTEADPFRLATVADLDALAGLVNSGNQCVGEFFLLTADIGTEQAPVTGVIGDDHDHTNWNIRFGGTIDGDGHTVYVNIQSANGGTVGLVGASTSSGLCIRDLTLRGQVKGGNQAGAFLGSAEGTGRIENCQSYATVVATTGDKAGGIVGKVRAAFEIVNCQNHGTVQSATAGAGGIVGMTETDGAKGMRIENCRNDGNVTARQGQGGGILGAGYGTIRNCVNYGTVQSASGYSDVGGIAGKTSDGTDAFDSVIENCANFGAVHSGQNTAGGIVGNSFGTLRNVLNATADVLANSYVGNAIGYNDGAYKNSNTPVYESVYAISGKAVALNGNLNSGKGPDPTEILSAESALAALNEYAAANGLGVWYTDKDGNLLPVDPAINPYVFDTVQLALDGEMAFRFYGYLPDSALLTDGYVEFEIGDVRTAKVYLKDLTPDATTGRYMTVCYLNVLELAEPITAVFHSGDKTATREKTSVTEYLNAILALHTGDSDEDKATTKLANAIFNYAHFAQLALTESHTEYTVGGDGDTYLAVPAKTDVVLQDTVSLADFACTKTTDPEYNAVTAVSVSLALDDKTAIILYLTPANGEVTPTVEVSDANGEVSVSCEKQPGGRYRVKIANIPAHKLQDAFTVKIDGGSENGGMTISGLSALTYAYSVFAAGNKSENYQYAMSALLDYSEASAEYRALH